MHWQAWHFLVLRNSMLGLGNMAVFGWLRGMPCGEAKVNHMDTGHILSTGTSGLIKNRPASSRGMLAQRVQLAHRP